MTPIVGKALKWSRELAKQAFFLTFITKGRQPVLYGVLNQRPNAKVAVMMHLGDFSLWFAPSFTADCTFVRATCLTDEDERKRDELLRRAKVNMDGFNKLVAAYISFWKEAIMSPFVYGNAVIRHIRHVAKGLYDTSSSTGPHRYNLTLLIPPTPPEVKETQHNSSEVTGEERKGPEVPSILGEKRPSVEQLSPTTVTREPNKPFPGTPPGTPTPVPLLPSGPPPTLVTSSPTALLPASPTVDHPPPATKSSTEVPPATSSFASLSPDTATTEITTTTSAPAEAANQGAAGAAAQPLAKSPAENSKDDGNPPATGNGKDGGAE